MYKKYFFKDNATDSTICFLTDHVSAFSLTTGQATGEIVFTIVVSGQLLKFIGDSDDTKMTFMEMFKDLDSLFSCKVQTLNEKYIPDFENDWK